MAPLVRVLITGTSLDLMRFVANALEKSGELNLVGIVLLEQAEASCRQFRPEAVLMTDGLQAAETLAAISRLSRHARVLLFGTIEDDAAAEGLLAGACGVLQGDATAREIVDMIRATEGDGVICPDRVTYALFSRLTRLRASRTADRCLVFTDLSFQEVGILRLLGAGLSNKQIAQQTNLSVHTVKNYVHRILKQLGLRNRMQAAAYLRTIACEAFDDGIEAGEWPLVRSADLV